MKHPEFASHEAAILARLVSVDDASLTRAWAEGILSLHFSPVDKERMHALTAKARAGELTTDDQAEVEAYCTVGSLLGILQSRARRVLKARGSKGKRKAP